MIVREENALYLPEFTSKIENMMAIDDDGTLSPEVDDFLDQHEKFIENRDLRKTKTLLHLLKKVKNANTNVKLLQPIVYKLFY